METEQVEKNWLVSKLKELLSSNLLDVRRFGHAGLSSVWVEMQSLHKTSELLKEDSELQIDWLENLSVVEFDNVLVVNYFLRSYSSPHQMVMRVSAVPEPKGISSGKIRLPSVRTIWPMAESMENEAEEMFGIYFDLLSPGGEANSKRVFARVLPENWVGFPMRKSYQFPSEVYGISHASSIGNGFHGKN